MWWSIPHKRTRWNKVNYETGRKEAKPRINIHILAYNVLLLTLMGMMLSIGVDISQSWCSDRRPKNWYNWYLKYTAACILFKNVYICGPIINIIPILLLKKTITKSCYVYIRPLIPLLTLRGQPGLNQWPLDLHSNALPLSYVPL